MNDDLYLYRKYPPSPRCNHYGWCILCLLQKEVEDQERECQSTDDDQDIMYIVIGDEEIMYHTMAFLQIPPMFGGSGASAFRILDILDLYDPISLPLDRKVIVQGYHVGVTILELDAMHSMPTSAEIPHISDPVCLSPQLTIAPVIFAI